METITTSIVTQIEAQKKNSNLKLALKEKTEAFTDLLYYTLFDSETPVERNLKQLVLLFEDLIHLSCWETDKKCSCIWEDYVKQLPHILELLHLDAQAFLDNDPAANAIEEIYTAYPGFHAIAIYRLSHPLYLNKMPLVPRLMTEYSHRLTGTDINPGASIGKYFFIDVLFFDDCALQPLIQQLQWQQR